MSNLPEERIGVLETKMKEHERRLMFQEDKNEQLNDISTYVRLQYEHNKRQDEKIEELFDKLGKINQTTLEKLEESNAQTYEKFEQLTKVLDGINTSMLGMSHDIRLVKDRQDVTDGKIESLEDLRAEEEENIIKGLQEAENERRKMFRKVVLSIAIPIITAAALLWLGLS